MANKGPPRVKLFYFDPSINLTINQIGLRQLLNRKAQPLPKPLLKIVYKGCLRSTFDEDEFMKGDNMECLVSQPVQCSLQDSS